MAQSVLMRCEASDCTYVTPEGTRDQVIEMLMVCGGVAHDVQVFGRGVEAPPRQGVGGDPSTKPDRPEVGGEISEENWKVDRGLTTRLGA